MSQEGTTSSKKRAPRERMVVRRRATMRDLGWIYSPKKSAGAKARAVSRFVLWEYSDHKKGRADSPRAQRKPRRG